MCYRSTSQRLRLIYSAREHTVSIMYGCFCYKLRIEANVLQCTSVAVAALLVDVHWTYVCVALCAAAVHIFILSCIHSSIHACRRHRVRPVPDSNFSCWKVVANRALAPHLDYVGYDASLFGCQVCHILGPGCGGKGVL